MRHSVVNIRAVIGTGTTITHSTAENSQTTFYFTATTRSDNALIWYFCLRVYHFIYLVRRTKPIAVRVWVTVTTGITRCGWKLSFLEDSCRPVFYDHLLTLLITECQGWRIRIMRFFSDFKKRVPEKCFIVFNWHFVRKSLVPSHSKWVHNFALVLDLIFIICKLLSVLLQLFMAPNSL